MGEGIYTENFYQRKVLRMELSKYIKSVSVELQRSQIHFATYNPRRISEESKKTLKRGIKKFGLAGGIIVNKRTNYTIVSGHQRVAVLDELQKYDPETNDNDYNIRVDLVDIDEKSEKELNILTNNPNAMGEWDLDSLASLIPDIDYKDAGLTEADLSMIGCDYLFKTEEEDNLNSALDDLMQDSLELHGQEVQAKKEERQAQREQIQNAQEIAKNEQADYDARVQHMKDVKAQVREKATEDASNMDAYVMLSFDTFKAKAAFMQRFGYNEYDKIIKGEYFSDQIERIE